jgi:lactate dehydrogenase-like 2-hydroxyacid dehydrogenase
MPGFLHEFKELEVLSLHLPWTPETDKMVNSTFINSFAKPFGLSILHGEKHHYC